MSQIFISLPYDVKIKRKKNQMKILHSRATTIIITFFLFFRLLLIFISDFSNSVFMKRIAHNFSSTWNGRVLIEIFIPVIFSHFLFRIHCEKVKNSFFVKFFATFKKPHGGNIHEFINSFKLKLQFLKVSLY